MSNANPKHSFLPLLIAASLCVGILIGFSVSRYQFASDNVQVASKKFRNIFRLIEKEYTDSVDINLLFEKSIAKTLAELDPHCSYITPRDLITKTNLDSEISGIGVRYSIVRDTLLITEVLKNGPAYKSGLLAGDRILMAADSNLIAAKDQTTFPNLIRGDKGTKVKVQIYRKSTQSFLDFAIVRNDVPVDAVELSYLIDPITGYIKLSRFSENSGDELHNQLLKLKKLGMKQLILDLRDNGGGYYEAAVQMCDEFLPQGRDIVYTQSRGMVKDKKKSVFIGEFEHQKLIILINENSASASEIVSAALQDNDRAVLVGRRSFGKGLVQSPFTLFDGSEVRITTARYYCPSGRCLQKPYTAYASDTKKRLLSGELFDENKMFQIDSLKYHTLNQRTVYGGGGVYPDVFVPEDTSLNNLTIAKMLSEQLFLEFAVLYLKELPQLTHISLDDYAKKFVVTNSITNNFLTFCKEYHVKVPKKDIAKLIPIIKREIKTHLSEVLWGNAGMYRLMSLNDPFVLTSLQTFSKNTQILKPKETIVPVK